MDLSPLTRVLLLFLALLLVACSSDSSKEQDGRSVSESVLPPPLAELSAPADDSPAAVIDATNWQLPDKDAEPDGLAWLRLFFSQDNRGELDPCGCPGSPSGGMARRASLVRTLRQLLPDAVVVEGPTCLSRAVLGTEVVRGDHRSRARLLLELLAETQPRAFFPGNADFEVIDPQELARLAGPLNLPLVATNLRAGFAESSYRPYLVVPVKERRVVLLGLVAAADNEDVRASVPTIDAVQAANAALAAARKEHGRIDLVVAFTDAGVRELGEWRTAGLDVDILITPPVQGEADGPRWRDGQLLVKSEPLGRAFGRLDVVFAAGKERSVLSQPSLEWAPRHVAAMEQLFLDREPILKGLQVDASGLPPESVGLDGLPQRDPSKDPDAVRLGLAEAKLSRSRALTTVSEMDLEGHLIVPGLVLVSPALEEDESVKTRLADFHGANLKRISADLRAGGPAAIDEQYAGQDQCISCHAEEVARWSRGPHARAWLHLTQRGETRTAACLECHTTGFGEPGGFVDASENDSLLNVQCEACHGPMRLHARQAAQVGVRPSSGLPISKATCTRCHDAENSPDFHCTSYLRAVSHVGGADEVDASLERVCGSSQ